MMIHVVVVMVVNSDLLQACLYMASEYLHVPSRVELAIVVFMRSNLRKSW